jgi:hypothetical protein
VRGFDPVMMASMIRRTLDVEGLRVAHGASVESVSGVRHRRTDRDLVGATRSVR